MLFINNRKVKDTKSLNPHRTNLPEPNPQRVPQRESTTDPDLGEFPKSECTDPTFPHGYSVTLYPIYNNVDNKF